MSGNAIEAEGLSKRFPVFTERRTSLKERVVRGRAPEKQYFWALRDATFSVPRGASLGIIGHNGSGKSTALKVLTGIYRPTSGRVTVNGSVSALLEVGAGFHPELTGRENIRLNATILGFTGRQIDAMMDQIIEFADIGDHIDAPIKHYSSGMYVRLGFAVAVMVRPEILIVDEVIAVGDEEFQRKCYDHLHGLRRSGTTMVIVSHGLGQITDLCDEAIWLDHGRVAGKGPAPATVRAYLDSVNVKEAERVSQGRAVEQPAAPRAGGEAGARRGSGAIRFTGVELLDEDGFPEELLSTGRPSTIRLHYAARSDAREVQVDIALWDQSNVVVTGASNRRAGLWNLPAGRGHIDFTMDPLLLAGGVYEVRVEARVQGQLADGLDGGANLTVRAPEVETPGMYLQRGSWAVVAEPAEVARADLAGDPVSGLLTEPLDAPASGGAAPSP